MYCPLVGEGRKRSQISIANSSDYTLKIVEPDIVDLNGSLKMPSGAIEPCLLKKLADNHVGKCPTVTGLFPGLDNCKVFLISPKIHLFCVLTWLKSLPNE